MSPAGVGRPRQAVECPERVSMSWCAPPQACSLPGSLRSMLTTIPLNFAEECASPLVCTGKAKRHGPSVHLQTSRDALHPVAQPWQAGAGKSLWRCSPSLHEWHFRRGGRGSFGKDYVQLQVLRATALPRSSCAGILSSQMLEPVSDSPKPCHESIDVRERPG